MNVALIIFIACVAVFALIPLGFAFYRDWDYKRQVTGKKKMRTMKEEETVPESKEAANPRMEAEYYEYKMKSIQNQMR